MKNTYSELVEQLRSQQAEKKDLIVPSEALGMIDGQITLKGYNELDSVLSGSGVIPSSMLTEFNVLDTCHSHLSDKLGIPKRYYDRMLNHDNRQLIDQNVNFWFQNAKQNYMLRSFMSPNGNTARALLSDQYNILDNLDVLAAAIHSIQNSEYRDVIKIDTCDLTDKRMYVRFVAPTIEVQAPEILDRYNVPGSNGTGNSGVCTGFVLTNSEVGHGRFSISPRAVVLACKNGLVFKEDAFNRTHLGAKLDEGIIKPSQKTMNKNMELIMSQVQDAVKTFLSPDYLGQKIEKIKQAGSYRVNSPTDVITNVASHFGFSETMRDNILNAYIEGGINTAFGVSQAITWVAHTKTDADNRFDMESIGYDVLFKVKEFDAGLTQTVS